MFRLRLKGFLLVVIFVFILTGCGGEDSIEQEFGDDEDAFTLAQSFEGAWTPFKHALADFDGDDDLDLIVCCVEGSSFFSWNLGDGHFSEPDYSSSLGNARIVGVGDFDSDTDLPQY